MRQYRPPGRALVVRQARAGQGQRPVHALREGDLLRGDSCAMNSVTLTLIRKRLAQTPELPWSARHSQQGCQGAREAGAEPLAPCAAAPHPVSTVVVPGLEAQPLSRAPARAMAQLTT